MMAIEARGINKRYGRTVALDNVSLSLGPGVIYGLLGSNGSGKSALLRVLATLERPDTGRVWLLVQDVAQSPLAARRALGFVPDEFILEDGQCPDEHLDFVATCHGLSRRERLAAVETMLQLVDLEAQRGRPIAVLSRGQRQRLALAAAMVHNPPLLLLDQPLSGLDAAGREEMLEVLKELREMGKTIVFSTHFLDDIAPVCDAVGLMHKGRLLASGSIEEVLGSGATQSCADDPLARILRELEI